MCMRILGVVITDGVGYRNFVLSDFITEAHEAFDEVVIFSCLPKHVYDNLNLKCTIVELDVFEESFITWFFRKAKEVTHLKVHSNDNYGIEDNFHANYSPSITPRGIATRFIYTWVAKSHSEKWVQRYNRIQQKTFHFHRITKKYKQLLKEHNISMLFFTHQRPSYIAPLIYAAQQLKMKTTAFIFSWDNLASKGRMAGDFDYYLVWSDLMKQELLHFYKAINENQIAVVGTPQFEPYVLSRYGMSKEAFTKRFQLDENLPTVLFSCGDVSTSKNDPLYISSIASAIENNQLSQKVNFLVRTSPAEEPLRFAALVEKYPFIRWNYPAWSQTRSNHLESWSQRIPSVADVTELKAVLMYTDVSINMLSTMSLDNMLFDKPVINVVFGNPENGLYNDQRFLKYAHIQKVVQSDAVAIVKDENALLLAINKCLETPKYKLNEQKALLTMQIGMPLEGTSKRIATIIKKWS